MLKRKYLIISNIYTYKAQTEFKDKNSNNTSNSKAFWQPLNKNKIFTFFKK